MTDGLALPPGLILILAGLLTLVVPRLPRAPVMLGAPVLTLVAVWWLWSMATVAPEGGPFAGETVYAGTAQYLGMTLHPVRVDALAVVFATVFSLMAFAGALFAIEHPDRRELGVLQIYAGSAVGAVLAGDLVTLFVFWEVMAIASTVAIWSGGPQSGPAGLRYAVIHFFGGVLLMGGAAGLIAGSGSTVFGAIPGEGAIAAMILVAFLINAGGWPLNAWVADAYPRASIVGTVFLSAFTTKTAIYALIRGFPGEEWLLWIGMATIVYGVLYALVESEIRRLLAYAIVAQSGFMLVGIGIGTDMGLNGAAGHAFVSILYSALLFMAAGAVMQATGESRAAHLGGLVHSMPRTAWLAVFGGFCIASFPGTGSYVSKSLISSGAGYAGIEWVWYGLTAAGVGVVLSVAIRFPWLTFFGPARPGVSGADPDRRQQAAMGLLAALVLLIALMPGWFYAMLPHPVDYTPYKGELILGQIELLAFGAVGYGLALWLLPARDGITLDTDWLYRDAGRWAVRNGGAGLLGLYDVVANGVEGSVRRALRGLYRAHGPESVLSRTRPTGYVALWMTALLVTLIVIALV